MSALAKESDMPLLQAFSGGLSPSVLADVVMANLDHLPQREDVAGAKAASSGTGALASLMQVSIYVHALSYGPNLLLQRLLSIASSVGYTCTPASARGTLAGLHCYELIVWAGDHRVKQIWPNRALELRKTWSAKRIAIPHACLPLYQVCVRTQNLMLQGLSHNQGPAQQAQQQQQQQSQTAAQSAAPQAGQVCPVVSSIAADSAVMSMLCAQELRPTSLAGQIALL